MAGDSPTAPRSRPKRGSGLGKCNGISDLDMIFPGSFGVNALTWGFVDRLRRDPRI